MNILQYLYENWLDLLHLPSILGSFCFLSIHRQGNQCLSRRSLVFCPKVAGRYQDLLKLACVDSAFDHDTMCDDKLWQVFKPVVEDLPLCGWCFEKVPQNGHVFNDATSSIAPILTPCLALGAEVQAQAITLLQTNEEVRFEEIQRWQRASKVIGERNHSRSMRDPRDTRIWPRPHTSHSLETHQKNTKWLGTCVFEADWSLAWHENVILKCRTGSTNPHKTAKLLISDRFSQTGRMDHYCFWMSNGSLAAWVPVRQTVPKSVLIFFIRSRLEKDMHHALSCN